MSQKSAFDTPCEEACYGNKRYERINTVLGFNKQDKSFFNSLNQTKTAHVLLTAETEDFDEETTQQWRDEGFNTAYVPLLNGGDEYINRVHATGDAFGTSEYYAIVGNRATHSTPTTSS